MLARGWLSLFADGNGICFSVTPVRIILLGPDGNTRGCCARGDVWVWENTSFPEACCLCAPWHLNQQRPQHYISLPAPFCRGLEAQGYQPHGPNFPLSFTASALLAWTVFSSRGAPNDNICRCGSCCWCGVVFIYAGRKSQTLPLQQNLWGFMKNQARQLWSCHLCQILAGQFLLRSAPPVPHLSSSNGSRSSSPKGCPRRSLPIQHMPQFLSLWVAKLNFTYAAGKCQALPRLVPIQCPLRLQCSESPKTEALGLDSFTQLCPPSLLFMPNIMDIMINVKDSQTWPEGLTINKMPFMKWFLPGLFNEKHFAMFYLSWMPQWDWREVCSSGARVLPMSQRFSEVALAFLKLGCLWLTNLCLAFRWEREIEERCVNRQTGAGFIPASANHFS